MTVKSVIPAALTWSGVTARRMARDAGAGPGTGLGRVGLAWVRHPPWEGYGLGGARAAGVAGE